MSEINIYTDGSCRGNPGPGGWAALLFQKNDTAPFKILKGNDIATTNNRMEMIAIIEALRFIQENHLQNRGITLYSDSNLVIQTMLQGWKRKMNQDLWEELDQFYEGLRLEWKWVRGHANNKWNNECDRIAQQESLKSMKKRKNNIY